MSHAAYSPPSSVITAEDDLFDSIPIPEEHPESQRSRIREETSLYLGLFSLTPLLLVFESWAALPAFVLAGLALWTVYKLHRNGFEAVILHAAAWTMMILGISVILLFPPFTESESVRPFTNMIYSVALLGIFFTPLFALLSLLHGARNYYMSVKQIAGMSASFFHALIWIMAFILFGTTGFSL